MILWSNYTVCVQISSKDKKKGLKLVVPSSESDEGLEYLAQKLQDKMLKFRTTLSPAKLLKIIKETKAEVRETFDDLALVS